jgi:hypothetical protein
MRFEGFAHERVANQLIRYLRNQAIEPSFSSETVPEKLEWSTGDSGSETKTAGSDQVRQTRSGVVLTLQSSA